MTIVNSRCLYTCLWLAALTGVSNGFVTPSTTSLAPVTTTTTTGPSSSSSTLGVANTGTGWDNFCIENLDDKDISPEEARRYRRTVYTHIDWVKHRQQDRFFIYLGSLFDSGVFRNSEREVYVCTTIAAFVCVYNAIVGGYTDFAGVQHPGLVPSLPVLGLPMTAFTITGSSLGLLLSK